jgi:hypothetical protein
MTKRQELDSTEAPASAPGQECATNNPAGKCVGKLSDSEKLKNSLLDRGRD